jgi:hypothetical protein
MKNIIKRMGALNNASSEPVDFGVTSSSWDAPPTASTTQPTTPPTTLASILTPITIIAAVGLIAFVMSKGR